MKTMNQNQNRNRPGFAELTYNNVGNRPFTLFCGLIAGVMVLAHSARGGTAGFQFQGVVDALSGTGAAWLPASVTNGAPVIGEVRYQPSQAGADLQPTADTGIYSFGAGTLAMTMKIGNSSFESDPSVVNYVTVYNDASGSPASDRILYSATRVLVGGLPLAGNPDASYWNVDFSTTNLAALNSDALPTKAPSLSDFVKVGGQGYRVVSCYTYKNGNYYYGFSVEITAVSPIPELQIVRQGTNCIVFWPATAQYSLETATDVTGPWLSNQAAVSETNSVQSITVPTSEQRRFYRLVKTEGAL
jgi:hypothetical protein